MLVKCISWHQPDSAFGCSVQSAIVCVGVQCTFSFGVLSF
jgi:hypothetical protein